MRPPANDIEMQRLMDDNENSINNEQNEETIPPPYVPLSDSNEDELVALRREVQSLRDKSRRGNNMEQQEQLVSQIGSSTATSSSSAGQDTISLQLIALLSQGLPSVDEILMFKKYWSQLCGCLTILGYTQCIQFVNNDVLNRKLDNENEEKFVSGFLQSTLSSKFSFEITLAQQTEKIGSPCVSVLNNLKHQYESAKFEFLSDMKLRMEKARYERKRAIGDPKDEIFFVNFKKWFNQLKEFQLDDEITESQVIEYAYADIRQTSTYTAWAQKFEKEHDVDAYSAYKLFCDLDELAGAVHYVMSTKESIKYALLLSLPFVFLLSFVFLIIWLDKNNI
ncbi:unnamed protein product [Ambrosiozyma monospora]|uniref:Unnamed protein product n=1 Tax=Ambrosiozyma monospora TaxID=43982 RepID=A0ACB5SZ05_AMBMO|nr:unnamed protein product [Ambrosiozyma monospora]